MTLADELESVEKEASIELGHVLHPAGGLTETFVYEPLGPGKYVYRTKDGKKKITSVRVEYEDSEKKKKPSWFINVEGKPYYFSHKPPKDWLFNTPDKKIVEQWVNGERRSLPRDKIWNLNKIYLKTFLDLPHEYEFSIMLLFVQQTWLTEILPVVFYLGIKGEFGGGKTVTGEAVTYICRHGYLTGNLSPPFVARTIQDQKITLMVDELDTIAGTKDSNLNSIFRQGYRRGLKYSRVNPDTLQSESYDIFGPKLFTVHSDIEEALQTRTVPVHVRETEKLEYPIVNLDKEAYSRRIYVENFLWYLDNILTFRDNEAHVVSSLTDPLVDIVDIVDPFLSDQNVENPIEQLRETSYKKKETLLQEGQLSQLSQLTGRNVELMYLCFVLSNLIGKECNDDILKTFQQKIIEEGERTELGYLGVLRDVLVESWKDKKPLPDYNTEAELVKISNKELYQIYNDKLKEEYGHGVSPHKFKEYLLEFGFTDALNRKKLPVPLRNESEASSRLCNIFTNRVLRKLDLEDYIEQGEPIMVKVKSWCQNHHDEDRQVNLIELTEFIKEELKQEDPKEIIKKIYEQAILQEGTKPGKAVLV